MAGLIAVSDASALIALRQIALLDRVAPLFVQLLIPTAVAAEIAPSVGILPWATVQSLSQPIPLSILAAGLGPGETEALALTLEAGPDRVILDDLQARRLGKSLGLPVVGTVGILVDAKHARLVDAVRPSIEALLRVGFHISTEIIDQVLADPGE